MTRQAKRRSTALVALAVVIGALTLCLVFPLLLSMGGTVLWVLLVVGVLATAAASSRAVWDVLGEESTRVRH